MYSAGAWRVCGGHFKILIFLYLDLISQKFINYSYMGLYEVKVQRTTVVASIMGHENIIKQAINMM